jgi:hypothetical protein
MGKARQSEPLRSAADNRAMQMMIEPAEPARARALPATRAAAQR